MANDVVFNMLKDGKPAGEVVFREGKFVGEPTDPGMAFSSDNLEHIVDFYGHAGYKLAPKDWSMKRIEARYNRDKKRPLEAPDFTNPNLLNI